MKGVTFLVRSLGGFPGKSRTIREIAERDRPFVWEVWVRFRHDSPERLHEAKVSKGGNIERESARGGWEEVRGTKLRCVV